MSIKLKLIKGLSYRGGKEGILKATKDKPFCFVETMEEAEAAIASGHFQLVEVPKVEVPKTEVPKQPSNPSPDKSIGKMTKDELEAYAVEIGVDISECKNNDERKDAIKNALEKAESKKPEPDNDGDGSDDDSSKVPFEEEKGE